jgi:predicted RNase H-like HicB family nuclease
LYVPALPGGISEGDSREEAPENIREAIQLYLEASESQQVPQEAMVEKLVV